MSQSEYGNTAPALGAGRRKTVKLGKRFASSLAVRLDAHPQAADTARVEDENRILALMHDVLIQADPDPCAVNFITHAVEVHTATYGFSKVIYDELFKLHQARLKRKAPEPAAKSRPERASSVHTVDNWKHRRALKA